VTAAPGGAASMAVQDTGSGMTADELAHAFDRFYRGSDSRGTGLGLTIAKSLVTAHGGEIRAASEKGQGTTITVTFPS
jgi:signal transduction histidine kinase